MIATRKTAALLAVGLAGAVLLSGCIIPITIIEMLFPKSKVPPAFALPPEKTVLVFPDDLIHPISYPPVKRAVAEEVGRLLKENEVVADVVSYDRLVNLQQAEPQFNRWAISTVGKKLGADLVVYVNFQEFSLKDVSVGTLWRGRLGANVRVVDVHEARRIWPDESAGRAVSASEPTTDNASESYGAELARKLAGQLAEEVAGLFHSRWVDRHRPKETEPHFDD